MLAAVLQELVLYDNNVSQVMQAVVCRPRAATHSVQHAVRLQLPDLGAFSQLQKLDLSHNQLRQMTQVESVPALHLQELYLTSNKLSVIQASMHNMFMSSPRMQKQKPNLDHVVGIKLLDTSPLHDNCGVVGCRVSIR